MEDAATAAVRILLGEQGLRPPAKSGSFLFRSLVSSEPGPCIAVDGSHAVLVDTGSVWVVATRAAATAWPGPQPEVQAELHAARVEEAQDQVTAAYLAHGLEPPRTASATAWAEAWRALREMECARAAIARAPPGSLLLVDGALAGLPPGPQQLADRIAEAAERHGLRLAGVAKRSGLARDSVPLVAHLHATGPAGPWSVQVEEGVHVAKLHARAPHAFRIDARDEDLLATLVPLARDAVYVGYPYPLAVAHNRVALTGGAVAELKARLAQAARREGGSAATRLFADFHDVLDRNVPG